MLREYHMSCQLKWKILEKTSCKISGIISQALSRCKCFRIAKSYGEQSGKESRDFLTMMLRSYSEENSSLIPLCKHWDCSSE